MHALIVGGSVTGLGTAVALLERGHHVTILERDATPMPPTALEAFTKWDRRGSPQTRHSHAFLARLYNLIRDHAPELLERLVEAGAEPLPFRKMAERFFPDLEDEPGDEDITMLSCRRITFEWVLRRFVLDSGRVEFRDGDDVTGLLADPPTTPDAVPRVRGVRLRTLDGREEELHADLVIDASGRRSKFGDWLEAIGAARPREESEPCGIFYSSRFYRLRDGAEPPLLEGMGADVGYMKYGIFPGDARIFSITLAASPEDDQLRGVLREPAFERATAAFPALASWTDPAIAEPISGVHGMGNLRNTRRFMVADGEPLALGVCAVGDALIHTNPIVGRGCTFGWVGAFELARAIDEAGPDPRAILLDYDAAIEREVVPWYDMQIQQDRDAIDVDRTQREGEDPFAMQRADGSVNPKGYMRSLLRDGLGPAMREDLFVLRRFMRLFNLLDAPGDLLKDPEIMQRLLASWQRREEREPIVLGPSRNEMLELLAQA